MDALTWEDGLRQHRLSKFSLGCTTIHVLMVGGDGSIQKTRMTEARLVVALIVVEGVTVGAFCKV